MRRGEVKAAERGFDAEAAGAYFGIAGALVLALAIPQSKWAWWLLLGSNFCWLAFAIRHRYRKLMWQTIAFTGSSVLGIGNSFYPGNPFQAWLSGLLT
jgi:hypothetical protein